MTRAILLATWSVLGLLAAIGAVFAASLEAWLWTVALATLALQWVMGVQLLIHGAQIERWHDVIGAWRRQDPEAWRRP